MVKKNKKRSREDEENESLQGNEEIPAPSRMSDEPPLKKVKWINKQRVLILASRGITYRDRHLMEDLRTMMPHAKPDSKMEKKEALHILNELCEMKNCNKCIFFEGRKKKDLYMWISNIPRGPSAKFLVENVHTMAELKMTGNCLKGSRPILSFDGNFDSKPHYSLLKEVLVQIFSTPNHHPKSQPFIDHVLTFSILDNRIWFRNFQIVEEEGALAEIGPRFVLNPIKIFEGSFGGRTLWENPHYVSPNMYRRQLKNSLGNKYINSTEQKINYELTKPKEATFPTNSMDEVFEGDPFEKALEIQQQEEIKKREKNEEGEKKKRKKKRSRKKKADQNPSAVVNGLSSVSDEGDSGVDSPVENSFTGNKDMLKPESFAKTKPQLKKKKKNLQHENSNPQSSMKKVSPTVVAKKKKKFNKKLKKQKLKAFLEGR